MPTNVVMPQMGESIAEGILPDKWSDRIRFQNVLYGSYAAFTAAISFTAFRNYNADLQYFCTGCSPSPEDKLSGFIADVSEDYVPLGGNFVSLLEKTFSIQGREDGMVLKARFLVTYHRIELSAMWLALPNANSVATDINHY